MGVTIAPAPPAGELVWRWGIQSSSASAFQYRTLPPAAAATAISHQNGAPGQTESTTADGVGLRARVELAVGGAGTGTRGWELILAAGSQAGESPWYNLLSFPQTGLPDFTWSWSIPVRADVTAVTDVVGAWLLVGLQPSFGTGVGNPGWLPERPNVGWICTGGNWRAVAYPGGPGGGGAFVPLFDEGTTAPANSRQLLELRLSRGGGQADAEWVAQGRQAARWRPTAPQVLGDGGLVGARAMVGVTRASAAGTDGVVLDILGDQASVIRSRYAIP